MHACKRAWIALFLHCANPAFEAKLVMVVAGYMYACNFFHIYHYYYPFQNSMMAELKTRVEELKMENEYQLRLKDMNYNEKIKELTEKFIQEMESLKTKNQVLKTDKDKEEAKHDEEVSEFREKHARELQVSMHTIFEYVYFCISCNLVLS